ncbi:MAG: hypothetical protein QG653_375 [Patescibacteria group bacterium]|nr:hypothetical protein [Patescibacteria group bacterium]
MKITKNSLVIIVGLIVLLGGIWYVKSPSTSEELISLETATTTEEGVVKQATPGTTTKAVVTPTPKTTLPAAKKLETYTNGIYKFTLSYPKEYQVEQFSNFHELNNVDWRVKATTAKRGVPVIALPVFRIDQGTIAAGKKYPLYLTAEVRVGVSPDTAQCYATDDGYTNQKVTTVVINGVSFKKFDFSDAAMMKYVKGSSYRTIYANKCYVIEQVRNGTIYKDDTMLPGYTESELDAIYNNTTPIVYSFKFI